MKQKNRRKQKTALLAAALAVALGLPSHAWAQNALFDHENYGNSYTGSFIHQGYGSGFTGSFTHEAFGSGFTGSFTHEAFGNDYSGNFTHEGFGNNYLGDFNHEFFGDDYIGNFGHESFGGDVPLASGLFVLTLAGAGYAVKKRSKNKRSSHA
jgi:hypothetical protein